MRLENDRRVLEVCDMVRREKMGHLVNTRKVNGKTDKEDGRNGTGAS